MFNFRSASCEFFIKKKSHDIALHGVTSMSCLKVIFKCSHEESVDTTAEHMHSIT